MALALSPFVIVVQQLFPMQRTLLSDLHDVARTYIAVEIVLDGFPWIPVRPNLPLPARIYRFGGIYFLIIIILSKTGQFFSVVRQGKALLASHIN